MSKNYENTVQNAEKPTNISKHPQKYRKTVKIVEKQSKMSKKRRKTTENV